MLTVEHERRGMEMNEYFTNDGQIIAMAVYDVAYWEAEFMVVYIGGGALTASFMIF